MQRSRTITRAECRKLMVSAATQDKIELEVAFHPGQLTSDFCSNQISENDLYNADKTNFTTNIDDHRTLALVGQKNVRCADVVSGDDFKTMMVLIASGTNARFEASMLIFKKTVKHYPIRGLQNNVSGVIY